MNALAALGSRWVWLDGGERPGWDTPVLASCAPGDPSITFDAATRTVTRHTEDPFRPGGWCHEVLGVDPFAVLAELMAQGEEWFGWFGYAARTDLPARIASGGVPDAVWMRPSRRHQLPAPANPLPPAPPRQPPAAPAEFRDAFAQVRERLFAGDSYEVNLTLREAAAGSPDVGSMAHRLRSTNPAPFSGAVAHEVPGHSGALVSASPERYLRVRDGRVETRPIKGTSPRGGTPEQDAASAHWLATDPKTRAENLMITDLLRHDVSLVSEPGSVAVPELMVVESHPSVHQLVTAVTGRLSPGISPLAATRALFPAGSMTGAPKLRTMEIIEATESSARGVYAGAFGALSTQRADLAVVIRSVATAGDGRWVWGAGGGITVDSEVEAEWAELCWKAERLRAAVTATTGS